MKAEQQNCCVIIEIVSRNARTEGLKSVNKPSSCCLDGLLLYIRNMAKAEWGWSKQDPEWVRSPEYSGTNDRASSEPLTVEQKKSLLTDEYLSRLSLGEYMALWRRLHPHVLTKVSRQGFVDYTIDRFQQEDLFYYVSDFQRELENGKLLRGRLHRRAVLGASQGRIHGWLESILQQPTKEHALEKLRDELGMSEEIPYRSGGISVAMDTKISLLSLDVLPEAYGAERNNAVFTVFPTDVVLSQHRFQVSKQVALWVPSWNHTVDVWPNDLQQGGLSQDAGIVFLPKSAQVDPLTGSRYAAQSTSTPLFPGDHWRMKEKADLPELFIEQMYAIPKVREILQAIEQDRQTGRNGEVEKRVEDFRVRFPALLQPLGYEDSAITMIVKRCCDRLAYGKNPFEFDFALMTLAFSGELFERPKETIRSEEFWEQHFAKNPTQKPARVVYYEGEPAMAMRQFLKVFGIETPRSKPKAGNLLGFDNNMVSDLTSDPQMVDYARELWTQSARVIDAHYAQRSE